MLITCSLTFPRSYSGQPTSLMAWVTCSKKRYSRCSDVDADPNLDLWVYDSDFFTFTGGKRLTVGTYLRVEHKPLLVRYSDDDVTVQRSMSDADDRVWRRHVAVPGRHCRRYWWQPCGWRDGGLVSVVGAGRRKPARHRRSWRRRHTDSASWARRCRRWTLQVGGDLKVLVSTQHRAVDSWRHLIADGWRARRPGWSRCVNGRRRVRLTRPWLRCDRVDVRLNSTIWRIATQWSNINNTFSYNW